MIKQATSAVGAVVCVAAVVFVGIVAVNNGVVSMPERQAAPPPTIVLHGPTQLLAGQEYYFHVEMTGDHGEPIWLLRPDIAGALTIFPDKQKARFQSTDTGVFMLSVAVGGELRQVASDIKEFENLQLVDQDDVQPPPSTGPPPVHTEPLPEVPTVAQLVTQAYNDVIGTDKVKEAHIIAGSIKALVARIETGLVPGDTDVMVELEDQVSQALGENARNWGLFVADIRAIVGSLREQGAITTAASAVPTLLEVAKVLSAAS